MSRLSLFASLISLALLAAGCSAESPDGDMLPGPDAGGTGDLDPLPGSAPTLTLEDVEKSWPYGKIPVAGTGPADGQVVAKTQSRDFVQGIGSDGTFCMDVPLAAGVENVIWFKAQDAEGNYSDEIKVTVNQEGEPADGDNEAEEPGMTNIARNGTVTGSLSLSTHGDAPDPNEFNAIVDGSPNTIARFEANFWGADWLSVKLSRKERIEHVHVVTNPDNPDCTMSWYWVYATDDSDPPAPGYAEPWITIGYTQDSAQDDTFNAPYDPVTGMRPTASHVAIRWINGGCTWTSDEMEIAEIEVYTADDDAEPTSSGGGPSCQSGGSE